MHLFLRVAFVCALSSLTTGTHSRHDAFARGPGRGATEKHAGLAVGTDQNTAALI